MEGGFTELISKLECAVKREKRSRDDYSNSDDDHQDSKQGVIAPKDNKLEQAKIEMVEVKEENKRLKTYLNQVMEDYKILQKKFRDVVDHQQELAEAKESASNVTTHQERELVSLCLGRSTAASCRDQKIKDELKRHNLNKDDEGDKEGLALGLDCKFEASSTMQVDSPANVSSADNSVEEVIREDQTWPPSKVLKKAKSNGDDEAPAQTNPAKKARVSVRVRCDTPTMSDGCQWRKYGQKIAKGNPCPRAYYRCTVSTTCPVRKQVQRCAQDMTILITTYEGTHNHPLPMSATAMASTTSAAASMLMSGSSTSSGSNPNNPSSTTTPAELHGLNFYFSDGSKPNPYYPQNPSISSSPSCPTITLDLTSNTISSSSSPFNSRSTHPSNSFLPRYSTTNLNFSSWNNMNGALTYGSTNSQPYAVKNQIGSLNFGRHPQENLYQSYMQKNMPATSSQQSLQADTIEAATKAITSDPNFQSVLQAALSSIISSSGGGGSSSDNKFGQNSKLAEALFPILSSFPSTSNTNNPPNKSTPMLHVASPINSSPFSTSSKSKSASPDESRDHVK